MANELPEILALSLWQPWASLMWHGAKMIETRSWKPPRTNVFLAIHAAKKWDEMLKLTARDPKFAKYLDGNADKLPRGCFGAIVWLERYFSTNYEAPSEAEDEFWYGDYSANRFGWVCPRVWELLEPVPARGQQGIWRADSADVLAGLSENYRQDLLNFWRSRGGR
jgi:activating signal cointegrator 1